MQTASAAADKPALTEIFGPHYKETLTGDAVQDATHAKKFAAAIAEGCNPVKDGDSKIILEIGKCFP